jgi:UDP-glucose 4-epimerase
MEIAQARVLVTGGAGLIGSHIADLLVEGGAAEVVVLDNLTHGRLENLREARRSGLVTVLQGDTRDAAVVARAMQGIDLVYHQAALRSTQCAERPRAALEVLIDGTFNVLDAAVHAGVKKVVAASSASVYGDPSYVPTDENHPLNNSTLYGSAQIANEHLLRAFSDTYGLPYVALRYFSVYGPRMDVSSVHTDVMVRWLDRIEAGEPPLIYGDGNQSIDFVHCRDVAAANLAAMRSDVTAGVFNVASGTETSLNDLAALMLKLLGRPDLKPEHREERAINPVRRCLADTSLARERLGFEARISLPEGLRSLIEWRATMRGAAA